MKRRKTTAIKRALHVLLKKQRGISKIEIATGELIDNQAMKAKFSLTIVAHEDFDGHINPLQIFPDWQICYAGGTFIFGEERKAVYYLLKTCPVTIAKQN